MCKGDVMNTYSMIDRKLQLSQLTQSKQRALKAAYVAVSHRIHKLTLDKVPH